MWNKSKAKTVKCLNLIVSNLHKNSKACETIAGARDFLLEFFDERASFSIPRPG